MASLYELAMDCKFTEVFNRARSHPEEAKFSNENNWVTLHILVWKKAPLSAVKAVYKAYPSGLQVRSKRGETALDMAENNDADNKIVSFLKLSEHAQMRDSVLQLSLFKASFDEIKETCKCLVNDNKVLKDQCFNLAKDNVALKEHTTSLKESTDIIKVSTDAMKNECTSLAEENKSLESEMMVLKGDNEIIKVDWSTLKDESDRTKEDLQCIKVANEALTEENAVLTTESDVLKKTVASLLGTCNYLSNDNEAVKDACNEIRRRSDASAFTLKDNLKEIEGKITHIYSELNKSKSDSKRRDLFVTALQTLMRDFDTDGMTANRKRIVTPTSPQSTACDL